MTALYVVLGVLSLYAQSNNSADIQVSRYDRASARFVGLEQSLSWLGIFALTADRFANELLSRGNR